YRCRPKLTNLFPNFVEHRSDTVTGCGTRYEIRIGGGTYYLDAAGKPRGFPRFALASAVLPVPAWVMEPVGIVEGSFLRTMLSLRAAYNDGLLGCSPSARTNLTILTCSELPGGLASDQSIFALPA